MALVTDRVTGQLTTSAVALFTVPDNQTYLVQNITVFNGSASSVSNIKFYWVESGGSADATTQAAEELSILPDKGVQISLKHNFRGGDKLFGEAGTTNAINYFISYAQRTD